MLTRLIILVICSYAVQANIVGYISKSDEIKLKEALTKSLVKLQPDDVVTSYSGIRGFNLLNSNMVLVLVRDNCHHLETHLKKTPTPEDAFHALTSFSLLKCQGSIHSDETIKALKTALESAESTSADIRYAIETLKLLKQDVPNPAKVSQLLQARLKADDSLQSVGHAMHASTYLGSHGKFAIDRIEEVLAQVDEVNGQLAQWEGGLTTTSLVLTALLKLSPAETAPFLTMPLIDKLASYILSRRTVQTPRGALALLEAAVALANSNYSPISVSVIGWSKPNAELNVRVCDIMGAPLRNGIKAGGVVAQSATRAADDVVVLSKQPLTAGASDTEYLLPLNTLEPGQYRILLSVNQKSSSTFTVKIAGPVTVSQLTIGLEDVDGSTAPQTQSLVQPKSLEKVLQGDNSHLLVVRFQLSRPVHQMFLRLHSGPKREIIFVAEKDVKQYKVAVNLGQEMQYSDTYDIELIVGDAIMSNPLRWHLGKLEVKLQAGAAPPAKQNSKAPKSEIKHLFRPAEKRPPQVVSMLFTGLSALPLLILLGMWAKLGVNVRNFSMRALPFHLGLAAILGLFLCFWLKLDMFTTCAWLVPIGGFTFLSGNVLLSSIAKRRLGLKQ